MPSVLVIEDEEGISGFIREALTLFGHRVETAADGREGIAKFDGGAFDLVITDYRMPGVDGKGVLEHIRTSGRGHVPIVGISGTPWLLDETGFDRILPKPFRVQELLQAIQHLTRRPAEALSRA